MRVKAKRTPLPLFRLMPILRLRKLSRKLLAARSGIPYPMVCRISKGRANPTWWTVLRLCKALDCHPSDFEHRRRA